MDDAAESTEDAFMVLFAEVLRIAAKFHSATDAAGDVTDSGLVREAREDFIWLTTRIIEDE